MVSGAQPVVLYWDASALVALLVAQQRTAEAVEWSRRGRVHLLSSLAWAEAHAAVARLRRLGGLTDQQALAIHDLLQLPPWERITDIPEWGVTVELALRWDLRGADLWHLALAKSLQVSRAELRLLSFDARLADAAAGEGLAPGS